MGILDILQGNDGAASPWGALYPSPLQNDPQQLAAIYAAAGMTPPQIDPFGDPSKSSVGPPPAPPTPPVTGFGASAAPFSFAGPGSNMVAPSQIAPPAPAVAPAPSPVAAPAPAAPAAAPVEQAEPIAVGNYQMPRIGAADDFEPDDETPAKSPTDVSAQSRQSPPGAPAAAPFSLGGVASGIGDRLGLAGKGMLGNLGLGPIGALAGGLGALISGRPTDPGTIASQKQASAIGGTAQALLAKNADPAAVSAAVAMAKAGDNKQLLGLWNQYYGPDKFQHVTKKDAFGSETIGAFDPTTGKTKFEGDGAANGRGGFLAPGVKEMDSTLTGKDYLAQFSPEIQAAVTNYIDGKSTPTGNPRQGFTQTVKMIAQKYGADIGTPADDANYSARRTMRNQLSSSAPSSLGGQINIGNTAAGHLADLSQKAIELGNVDTGIAPLTAAVNGVRGLGTEQAAKMEALKGAAQHYGQEITKFYAGSPGGTAERDRFIESVNGARSPKELAAILETEGELMRSRLDALGGQIKGVLGEEGAKQYPVLRSDGETALNKVRENVAQLKGGAPQTTAPTRVNSPAEASKLPKGTHFIDPNGVERVVP